MKQQDKIDHELEGLDQKLGSVIKKHEYDYMAVYNIYVKKKETELLTKIKEMQDSSNTKNKDEQIAYYKKKCEKLMSEAQEQEKIKEKLRDQIKSWKQKYDFEK